MPRTGSLSLEISATARVLRALDRGDDGEAAFPEALAAADAMLAPAEDAHAASEQRARVLVYAPAAHANRFQSLLYSEAGRFDTGLVALRDFSELDQLPLFAPFVCHLHWLAGITAEARDASEARAAIEAFLVRLDRLIEGPGARIVWTAHNAIPHDTPFPEEHGWLRRQLIDRCALIHCLTRSSIAELNARFDLGDTPIAVVPHPSYRGAYPDYLTRASARRLLGIDADAQVLLSFGSIQSYKGFDTLCEAFDLVIGRGQRRCHLLIAGGAADPALVGRLCGWAEGREDVTFEIGKIADDDVQVMFRAADLVVCPYRETMNSGVAILALSFGVPMVASAQGAFVELAGSGVVTFEPAGGAMALAEALRATLDDPGPLAIQAARFADSIAAHEVSRRFFEAIEPLWTR